MGWTSLHRERGLTDREFFAREFPNTLTRDGEILDCASVGSVFYAAVKQKDSGDVWALVVLMRRSRDHYNFTYKEMSEKSGPVEARCPARILDLLTPLPECHAPGSTEACSTCYAREWRDQCRANAQRQTRAKTVRPGTVVQFAKPMQFSNGEKLDTFVFVTRSTFHARDSACRYKIPRWRTDYAYEVIGELT